MKGNIFQTPAAPPPSYLQESSVNQQPGPQQGEMAYNQSYAQNNNDSPDRYDVETYEGDNKRKRRFNGENYDDAKYDYTAPPPPEAGEGGFNQAFKLQKPQYNDLPFAALFLLTVAGFIVVSVISINYYRNHIAYIGRGLNGGSSTDTLNGSTMILFAIVVAVALLVSALVLIIAQQSSVTFLYVGLICNVIFGVGTAIYYMVLGYWSAGIVFLILGLFCAWCFWSLRGRIPFSATVLRIVVQVAREFKGCFVIALLGLVLMGAFSYLFVFTIVCLYARWGDRSRQDDHDQATLIGLLVFMFYAGYYISEVLRTIIHVTISGIYGTWYYLSKSDGGIPKNPATASLKRALTYCFGSICFGSLIVSLIELLRQLINIAEMQAMGSGDTCGYCLLMVFDVFAYILDWCVRYFNHYAYSYIALYGKNYLHSARDTYHIFRYKGMDALVNDCIIDSALGTYSVFAGFLSAFAAYLFLRSTAPAYNSGGGYYAPIVAFSFVIATEVCNVITAVLTSGTATFFLCLAKDPEVFKISYPQDYAEVFHNYPEVMFKVETDR